MTSNISYKNMKGMHDLISAVLLIGVVLVVAVLVLNWASSLTKKETAHITNKTLDCSTAGISIEGIFINLGGNVSRVSVRNSGFSGDVLVDGVVLNTIGQAATNLTAFPIAFPKGALETIEFNISGKIATCSNFSRAIVSTQCTSDDQSAPLTCTA